MRRFLIAASAVGLAFTAAGPAHAGPAQDLLTQYAEGGSLAEGEAALAARRDARPRDQETLYALGLIQYARALERFAQGLVRHGFDPDAARRAQMAVLAGDETPPPPPSPPEPLTYENLRVMLDALVSDLDTARETLAEVQSRRVKLRVDLAAIRFDLDGDGTPEADAAPGGFLPIGDAGPMGPPGLDQDGDGSNAEPQTFVVAFDYADAIWLQGYAHLGAALPDFFLAHDFEQLVDMTFHTLFPGADLPMANALRDDLGGFAGAADWVAAIHLFKGDVIEPERRARVRQRLLAAVELSRRNLDAIEAERDDDRELFPNPRQTALAPDAAVTADQLEGWRGFLDLAEAALTGERLVPHWRLQRGVNLARALDEGVEFDLIGVIAGYTLFPYVEEGDTLTQEEFRQATDLLGPSALGFALWAN